MWKSNQKKIIIVLLVLSTGLGLLQISSLLACCADLTNGAKTVYTNDYPVVWDKIYFSGDNEDYAYVSDNIAKYLNENSVQIPFGKIAEFQNAQGNKLTDTFMGFHCGNTPSCKMCADRAVKYQLIQNRLLENGGKPDFTRGTLEGDIAPSKITFYRLQCDSEGVLRSYIAQGEVLDVPTGSFGGIGVIAIPEMGRFYRHVLIEKRYPHHGAVAFGHYGKALFDVFRFLGIQDIAYNQPANLPYPTENPFVK